jgi:hypothetical protein
VGCAIPPKPPVITRVTWSPNPPRTKRRPVVAQNAVPHGHRLEPLLSPSLRTPNGVKQSRHPSPVSEGRDEKQATQEQARQAGQRGKAEQAGSRAAQASKARLGGMCHRPQTPRHYKSDMVPKAA